MPTVIETVSEPAAQLKPLKAPAAPSQAAVSADAVSSGTPAKRPAEAAPKWLCGLCFLCIVLMANQIRIKDPGLLGKLSVSDVAFALGFILVVGRMFIHKAIHIRMSLMCLLPVLGLCAANGFAKTGMGGCVDAVQMAMLLVGGAVFFAYTLRHMPRTTLAGVTAGLVVNLLVAVMQDLKYGAFMTLAPKDVMELSLGFGRAMTGLFRSKIAFSLYVGATLCWLAPQWLSIAIWRKLLKPVRLVAVLALLAIGLAYIPNGMVALATAAVIVAACFAVSRLSGLLAVVAVALALAAGCMISNQTHLASWQATISPLKGYDYKEDAAILFNQTVPLQSDEASEQAHELKSSHYDFVAALRLSQEHPLFGVGSGNYQKYIGQAYTLNESRRNGQLVNARINDIETDSQAGWGILAASVGIPAALLFALYFLAMLGRNLARIPEDAEDGFMLHTGAAAASVLILLAMFLTDPLTRGLGWTFALALASAETGPDSRRNAAECCGNTIGRCRLAVIAVILLAGFIFIPAWPRLCSCGDSTCDAAATVTPPTMQSSTPATSAVQPTPATPAATPAAAPAKPAEPQAKPAPAVLASQPVASANDGHVLTAEDDDVYLVFNADKAINVTMPMRMEKDDSETYAKGILVIPDKSGVPPAGKKPALEYGGAEFEFILKKPTTATIWCSVVWDGSCGNTLDIKVDGEANSYTVGNDGTYNAWHWQQSPKTYKLEPGRHKITVLNREDGVKLSQVLLTNDKESIPEGVEGE